MLFFALAERSGGVSLQKHLRTYQLSMTTQYVKPGDVLLVAVLALEERERHEEDVRGGGVRDLRCTRRASSLSETYSWRGHPPVGHVPARFYGKGMRIDHFLLSTTLFGRVRRCDIMGRGRDRVGFMGSDHCPVVLELAPAHEAAAAGSTATSSKQN